jgi:hypothetical protein
MGRFGDFPEPVWYNPNGVANILSLYIMTKYYQVTMDTNEDNAMLVWKKDGSALRFAPVGKGLYACMNLLENDPCRWALINTVEDLRKEYTKQEYQDAVLARKVQNIIMFPGV